MSYYYMVGRDSAASGNQNWVKGSEEFALKVQKVLEHNNQYFLSAWIEATESEFRHWEDAHNLPWTHQIAVYDEEDGWEKASWGKAYKNITK